MRAIAIVGRGCVLPGAITPQALFDAVLGNRDCTSNVPSSRWRLDPADVSCSATDESTDKTWSLRGGYVTEQVAVPGLEGLDPLVHWAAFAAEQALDGVTHTGRGDVILGNLSFPSSTHSAYAEAHWLGDNASSVGLDSVDPRNRFSSGMPAVHVAQHLGLEGERYCLDAACASSLYAIAHACDRLQDGLCDVAIAGAVNRADDLFIHIGFCALQAMSKTGQSRPFHAQADGLVPGEGAAVVALKRLDDAIRDGDTIYGVIRGVGLSNDGRAKNLLAPAVAGQTLALQRAYEDAGWDAGDVDLVECHATGTPVGDATELQSTGAVFAGRTDVPIGSLKGNLGHLVTAAGAAGLIKVLEAMRMKTLPPTRQPDSPNPALDGSPFRLVNPGESWTGRRRAGVSAFGFGGNNAHLLVEAYDPALPTAQPVSAPVEPIVVVGLSVRVGDGASTQDFLSDVHNGTTRGPARTVHLGLAGLKTPPRDLDAALPQQWWALQSAREATAHLTLPTERTAVWVGMGCDSEIARYGARWRSAQWAATLGADADWAADIAEQFAPRLTSSAVVGTMPNIPANRVNSQLNVMGPSHTVSAEERSGLVALDLAIRALQHNTVDCAVVGAVDLSHEPVHKSAIEAVLGHRLHADAVVTLVLQRLSDADPAAVLAQHINHTTGVAHAASGLLNVAAGLVHGWATGADVSVNTTDMAGRTHAIRVSPVHRLTASSHSAAAVPTLSRSAHAPEVRVPTIETADPFAHLTRIGSLDVASVMAPPPSVMSAPVVSAPVVSAPVVSAPVVSAPVANVSVPLTRSLVVPLSAPVLVDPHSSPLASLLATMGHAHEQFIATQTASHRAFLQAQDAMMAAMVGAQPMAPQSSASQSSAPQSLAAQVSAGRAVPAPQTMARPSSTRSVTTPVVRPRPAVHAPVIAKPAPLPVVQKPTTTGVNAHHIYSTTVDPPAGLPTFDKAALHIHAAGNISEIFGAEFAPQDARDIVVRMPKPPLLLADRVTGIDAEKASMGLGTLWTESDVAEDAWFLDNGRVPPGILIESGQADLMLISWLGVDLFIPEGRSYRLLGCELVFHGDAPKGGDTLRYDIHIDDHAAHGDVRLFFFHYDCVVNGEQVLTVRDGQAGFFTPEELADSKGILWTPEDMELVPRGEARLDSPTAVSAKVLDDDAMAAFCDGRVDLCFGSDFDRTRTHTRTPHIPGGRMRFLDRVTDLDTAGGVDGRGYLRAEQDLTPDTWFFAGHFHNDPCMPGTLMLEACMQAMAVYLTGMGFTTKRDGWRFQPVPEQKYKLRCRGQVRPNARKLVYEVFVEEVWDGDRPTLFADILCTVDGLKAFHCPRMGLELVPDWPMDEIAAELLAGHTTTEQAASAKGHTFDYDSLLACAWGRPSRAFGPMYQLFDSHRTVARLPGPPYHFMHRVTELDGEMGGFEDGSSIVAKYDVPAEAWYFDHNGTPTMPMCVLMEAALQPCGWLASYVGSALKTEGDVMFRNLDGTATWHHELTPSCGTLTVRTTVKSLSQMGSMIIEAFDVRGFIGDTLVFDMQTVFGFFPPEAFDDQAGLVAGEGQQTVFDAPSNSAYLLADRAFAVPAIADGMLMMLDRVDYWEPTGGEANLGRIRSQKDIDAGEWCFKAHFFTDPVQPGSLGIEAFCQLLQAAMQLRGDHEGIDNPRFEPVALGEAMTWKYRGQVVPTNRVVTATVEVQSVERTETGVLAIAEAMLWVDGKAIYHGKNVGMRIVSGAADIVEPDGWVADHRPTWTVPAVPALVMVDRVLTASGGTALAQIQVRRWLPVPSAVTLTVDDELNLFANGEHVASAVSATSGAAPALLGALDADVVSNPYDTGTLFHGPAFQLVRELRRDERGASAVVDASRRTVPGDFHPALLDAATHLIPHDAIREWFPEAPEGHVAYPSRIEDFAVWGAVPTGDVRVEARPQAGVGAVPTTHIQIIDGDRVWCAFTLVEATFAKGTIGSADPATRRAFLQDGQAVAGLQLSTRTGDANTLTLPVFQGSNWLAGTIESAYGVSGSVAEMATQVCVKERIADGEIHPNQVDLVAVDGLPAAVRADQPITAHPVTIQTEGLEVRVTPSGPPRQWLGSVQDFWDDWFGLGRWPVEDLYYGLIETFVDRVVLTDPQGFDAVRGRSALYVANHQVGVESLLFSILLGGLSRVPTVTLAKMEHKNTWLGNLIRHCFSYPGVRDPKLIAYFDREDRASLPAIIGELAQDMAGPGRSVMVHVEGTRALDCTAPVHKMSGAFIDMALAVGAPVIPVRFVGALPRETMDKRLEFPVGMGKQDIYIGTPLLPETLLKMPYGDRKKLVLSAMNDLGPAQAEEQPFPARPDLEQDVTEWLSRHDVTHEHAVLRRVLERLKEPSPEMSRYLAGDTPSGPWWDELVARLEG
jgi:3-oxoacyl-(acyl-carrier-protein) synthase/3-hydroxymyristoyl/3-hydroxydecanoyl-(acyl carrier protein) dehydratase/1-acyl-sn-glycerol-3-phosphate acyltransferase